MMDRRGPKLTEGDGSFRLQSAEHKQPSDNWGSSTFLCLVVHLEKKVIFRNLDLGSEGSMPNPSSIYIESSFMDWREFCVRFYQSIAMTFLDVLIDVVASHYNNNSLPDETTTALPLDWTHKHYRNRLRKSETADKEKSKPMTDEEVKSRMARINELKEQQKKQDAAVKERSKNYRRPNIDEVVEVSWVSVPRSRNDCSLETLDRSLEILTGRPKPALLKILEKIRDGSDGSTSHKEDVQLGELM